MLLARTRKQVQHTGARQRNWTALNMPSLTRSTVGRVISFTGQRGQPCAARYRK